MKIIIGNGGEAFATLLKISALFFFSIAVVYLARHFSDAASSPDSLFFSFSNRAGLQTPQESPSPDSLTKTLNASNHDVRTNQSARPALQRMGILDENGRMTDDFEIGDYDPKLAEAWRNERDREGDKYNAVGIKLSKIPICPDAMREYIPCLDNEEAIKRLNSTEKGEKFERHCPEKGKELSCLIPAPKGYRIPIPWPKSRDEVWFNNVPHTRLAEDKGGQNWITVDKDKFKFPGGGTQFIHGADQYLDQIEKMVPDIAFGRRTRVALDVGCGVASFGAYLFSRNVTTLSVAPKDVHENQIQFALERGVPAMVAAFATRRLLYPSQAFDLIHCSRCRINWTQDDGILLLEVNRMLRAGGYFAWAAQPVYKHEPLLEIQWEEMVNLTNRLCWTLVKKEGYIAIWQKPVNNSCYLSREKGIQPPLCEPDDDPDNVWYVDLKPCISRLPNEEYGSNVTAWPERLQNPPDRLQTVQIDAYISRRELFRAESRYWKEIVDGYVQFLGWDKLNLRNVLDMRAGFGSFAAAVVEHNLDCWVLNVVPISSSNTLPVIYDRGLVGVVHDWCEPFDTYPRTYDLIHAAGLFAAERKRCNITIIMLEMDRILRPSGRVYIRDTVNLMVKIEEIGRAMGWDTMVLETSEGPHSSYRLLTCQKRLPLRPEA
ncbi:probable methyltransferase PMT11 [Andrographis paniculata]|uniref:probable methyltransferase PMT11 n=1 Tax=Andrographis paniculata TaxID=175694 RepID=UPI0021E98499|nr:probable methyltransferase PMT11 [Andrographis paniculata]